MNVRLAVVTWLLLLIMLGISLSALMLQTPWLRMTVHLGSAVVMGALVMAIFMRLRSADGLIRLYALGGLMWLGFLLLLTLLDFISR
ncbi:hypothetical protein QQM79_00125 [Marinobacteraceae bacterium S3BR75-40.1]